MAKRGRKKRDRKHSKANHGKRPNCGPSDDAVTSPPGSDEPGGSARASNRG